MKARFGWMVALGLLTGVANAAIPQMRCGKASPTWPVWPSINTRYSSTDLGSLRGYPKSATLGMNDRGQVLCAALGADGSPARAFLWEAGQVTDLGTASADGKTIPFAIDPAGTVVGAYEASDGSRTAFTWQDGTATVLAAPDGFLGAEARAISSDGKIAGDLLDGAGHHAAVWTDGAWTALPTLPGFDKSTVNGINASGVVIGAGYSGAQSSSGHAAEWSDGQVADLGVLTGYTNSEATLIDDAGYVFGRSTEPGGFLEATVWQGGTVESFGGAGTPLAESTSTGWVVGQCYFFYPRRGVSVTIWPGIFDLGMQMDSGADYHSPALANGIDAGGRMAMTSWDGHALLLTPRTASLTVSLDPLPPLTAGQPADLTVRLQNRGPDPATRTYVSLSVDKSWTLVSAHCSLGEPSFDAYGDVGCGPFTVAAGQEVVLTLTTVPFSGGKVQIRAGGSSDDGGAPSTFVDATVDGPVRPYFVGSVVERKLSRPSALGSRRLCYQVTLQVYGQDRVPAGVAEVYLSSARTPKDVILLSRIRLPAFLPPTYRQWSLQTSVPANADPIGKYVLVVLYSTRSGVPVSSVGKVLSSDPITSTP